MDLTQAIRARRSIRKFKPGASIPREDVETMLEAAMMSPSACNTRPWEFFVVEDPKRKEALRKAHPYASMLETAALAIVVCARPADQSGVCDGYWPSPRAAAIQEILDTQSVPVALVAVGVPDESPAARGHYDPGKVTWLA